MNVGVEPQRRLATVSRFARLAVVLFALVAHATVVAQAERATGTSEASLTLGVVTEIDSLLRLEIGTSSVNFDLASQGSDTDASIACLLGGAADVPVDTRPGEPPRSWPGGTSFDPDLWPDIVLEGGPVLTDFPPPVDTESIVCYATFELRPFATVAQWRLSATRFDVPGSAPLDHLYLGGGCHSGAPPGLVPFEEGETLALASMPADATCDVVKAIVAVKITDLMAIDAVTGLRYSLLSSADPGDD